MVTIGTLALGVGVDLLELLLELVEVQPAGVVLVLAVGHQHDQVGRPVQVGVRTTCWAAAERVVQAGVAAGGELVDGGDQVSLRPASPMACRSARPTGSPAAVQLRREDPQPGLGVVGEQRDRVRAPPPWPARAGSCRCPAPAPSSSPETSSTSSTLVGRVSAVQVSIDCLTESGEQHRARQRRQPRREPGALGQRACPAPGWRRGTRRRGTPARPPGRARTPGTAWPPPAGPCRPTARRAPGTGSRRRRCRCSGRRRPAGPPGCSCCRSGSCSSAGNADRYCSAASAPCASSLPRSVKIWSVLSV